MHACHCKGTDLLTLSVSRGWMVLCDAARAIAPASTSLAGFRSTCGSNGLYDPQAVQTKQQHRTVHCRAQGNIRTLCQGQGKLIGCWQTDGNQVALPPTAQLSKTLLANSSGERKNTAKRAKHPGKPGGERRNTAKRAKHPGKPGGERRNTATRMQTQQVEKRTLADTGACGADMTLSESATLADAKPRRPPRMGLPARVGLLLLPLPRAVLLLLVLLLAAASAVRAAWLPVTWPAVLAADNSKHSPR